MANRIVYWKKHTIYPDFVAFFYILNISKGILPPKSGILLQFFVNIVDINPEVTKSRYIRHTFCLLMHYFINYFHLYIYQSHSPGTPCSWGPLLINKACPPLIVWDMPVINPSKVQFSRLKLALKPWRCI